MAWLTGWKAIEEYTGLTVEEIQILAELKRGGIKLPVRELPGGKPMCIPRELDEWLSKQKYLFKQASALTGKPFGLRFDILKRDHFTCQYCGRSPEKDKDVTLHVDHIHPRSKGGNDDPKNLITSCQECNLGKSDVLL